MSQLYLKFPFKKNYLERDFYVSSSNYEAYKLIDSYPNWPGNKINLYGPSGCGKTHLANILNKKISLIIIKSNLISEKTLSKIDKRVVNECFKHFLSHSSVLKKLSETHNIPIFWYEDLYYGDGLKEISSYLKLKVNKTYKSNFLLEDKKERILKTKGDLI